MTDIERKAEKYALNIIDPLLHEPNLEVMKSLLETAFLAGAVYRPTAGMPSDESKSVHFMSEKMDWATPLDVFDPLNREFAFTLDVCATAENTKCAVFLTPEMDGLKSEWTGVCWMNPPYGREIGKWVEKARREAQSGRATVVCLLPARTDTKWWQDNVIPLGEIRFLRGRICFVGAKASAPFPSAIVIFHLKREGETK
jgi:phage N-6-adenine-methyltransferase